MMEPEEIDEWDGGPFNSIEFTDRAVVRNVVILWSPGGILVKARGLGARIQGCNISGPGAWGPQSKKAEED